MKISEKLRDAKFSKSIVGYATKEVDGLIDDLILRAQENEYTLEEQRAKLAAFEARTEAIAQKEAEAARLLESAKEEAKRIVSEAQTRAADLLQNARQSAEEITDAAKYRAESALAEGERRAAKCAADAKEKAELVLAAADRRGKLMLAEAKEKADAQTGKAAELAAVCETFENRFRAIVADTVKALHAHNASAPVPAALAKPAPAPKPVQPAPKKPQPEPETPVSATKPAEKPSTEGETGKNEPAAQTDYTFAGGKLFSDPTLRDSGAPKHHLYDTVQVSYEADDGYEDIRRLMESAEDAPRKGPTGFSDKL